MIYKYGIGEHVYIIENGMHIKEVIIVNIANGFYQVCFTDRRGSIKLRESRLYKTIGEAATKNSAAKNELSKLIRAKHLRMRGTIPNGCVLQNGKNRHLSR